MNPALELFLLFALLGFGVVGVGMYLSRDLIKRTCKIILDKDREEQRQLDERKLEGANRLQAEKEIDETLNVYDKPTLENCSKPAVVELKKESKEVQQQEQRLK